MHKITVIAVGALKEPYWKEAVSEYQKRLRLFAKISVIEVAETPFKSAGEAPAVLRAEAEAIRRKIPAGAFVVGLDKGGKGLVTEKFAELIGREGQGGREIAFLIGGPLGLDPGLANECHLKLSLSALTFTHGEARAILFEQLYRAMTILAGKTYHF